MAWSIWIAVGALALVGEALTTYLILGSFALAALVVAPLSLGLDVPFQVLTFCVISVVLLFAVRPAVLRLVPHEDGEAEQGQVGPVGRDAIAVGRIDRHGGEVRIGAGEFWSARPLERDLVIEPGAEVQIVRMEGLTAIVKALSPADSSALPIAEGKRTGDGEMGRELSSGQRPLTEVRTFLIADIRGYTRFTQERGDEAAARLVERFVASIQAGVEAHGGRVLEIRGDEALCVFLSPRQALRAALALQSSFADASQSEPEFPLPVGIGLDAGEAVVVGDGYRGGALNFAARLCGAAGPGEVLATEEVVHLAGRVQDLRYVDRGAMQLKGLAEPIRVIAVTAPVDYGGLRED